MRHTPTKLVSLRLPSASVARISRIAKQRKTTISAVMREAIEALDRPPGPSIWDQVEPLLGKRGSGKGTLSTDKHHLEGFGQ